jgi:hypothetical protein
MTVMALSTDGNNRYSRIKNNRSAFVNWTRPHPALQHRQLMPQRGFLGFKPAFRLEECGEQIQEQAYQRDHRRKREVILSPIQC